MTPHGRHAALMFGRVVLCADGPSRAAADLSAGGPFPVVVVSHGAGGHRDANYAQVQHLASHGYAVLALEPVPDDSVEPLSSGDRSSTTARER